MENWKINSAMRWEILLLILMCEFIAAFDPVLIEEW